MNLKKRVNNTENTGYTGKPDTSDEIPWSTEETPVPGMYKEQGDNTVQFPATTKKVVYTGKGLTADVDEMRLIKADPKKTLYNLTNEVARLQNRLIEDRKIMGQVLQRLEEDQIVEQWDIREMITNYLNKK